MFLKLFGIGLASAIFLDATIVRMVLVPAVMQLLGDAQLVDPELARADPAAPGRRARAAARGGDGRSDFRAEEVNRGADRGRGAPKVRAAGEPASRPAATERPRTSARLGSCRGSLRKARGPGRARGGAVQRRDRARRSGRERRDGDGRVLRARARRGAGRSTRARGGCACTGSSSASSSCRSTTLREVFRERTVTATLQCAGNRRAGLVAIRDIPGEAPWGPGATGTATWTRRRARRRARARRSAARRGARRLRRRGPLAGGEARRSASAARSRSTRRAAPRCCSPGR